MASAAKIEPETLERYRVRLRYKVAYHLGGFCPDIDDIVQETLARFLRAYEEDKIRNPENAPAFLSGVCNNVILEYRRRIWKEPVMEPGMLPSKGWVSPEAEAIEMREAISVALAELSSRDQHLLRAFYLQEKTKEEICRALKMTDPQFRVALFRAKDRFRNVYKEWLKRMEGKRH
ncbi:MAG: sigma-70 family RNA polymerase sigma factor [Bryobacteraceae bacterium]|nr:sigma-70 family RNA polymerase sigma factor [Bryobacteraceae bacterium]